MNVPDGWRLLPIEPTREMLDADFLMYAVSSGLNYAENRRNMWGIMLAAAPAAVVQAEPSDAYSRAVSIRAALGWKIDKGPCPILYTDDINGGQVCRDDVWLCKTEHLASAQDKLDAERYRFLRAEAYEAVVPHGGTVDGKRTAWIVKLHAGATYDSAVDAARGAK